MTSLERAPCTWGLFMLFLKPSLLTRFFLFIFALEQDLIDSKMSSQEEAGIGGVSETLFVAFPVWVVDLHGLA